MHRSLMGLLGGAAILATAAPALAAPGVQYETAAAPAGFDPSAVQEAQYYYHHYHHWHHWHHWHRRGPVVVIRPY